MRTFFFIFIVLLMFSSSCTLHFKASEIELDADRQRVETNHTYKLEQFAFLKKCSPNDSHNPEQKDSAEYP